MAKLIQATEAARLLGVSRQTIVNWSEHGVLNIVKIRHTHYVDKDAIDKIADDARLVADAHEKLLTLKKEYASECETLEKEKVRIVEAVNDGRWFKGIYNKVMNTSIQYMFFEIVVQMLVAYKSIDERNGMILVSILKGKSMIEVAGEHGITCERVRQIIRSVLKNGIDIMKLKGDIESIDSLRQENEEMKKVVEAIKSRYDFLCKEDSFDKEENERICQLFDMDVLELNLSQRAKNGIVCALGVRKVGELVCHSRSDLMGLRNFGMKSVTEVTDALEKYGLKLGMNVDEIKRRRAMSLVSND